MYLTISSWTTNPNVSSGTNLSWQLNSWANRNEVLIKWSLRRTQLQATKPKKTRTEIQTTQLYSISIHSWSFLLVVKCWYMAKMYHSVFHIIKGKKQRLPENILYTSRDLRGLQSVVWLHLSRSDHKEWNNVRSKGAMCLHFASFLIPSFPLS